MREIKFRAFDKSAKVMIEDVTVYNGSEGNVCHVGFSLEKAEKYYGDIPDYIEYGDDWVWLLENFEVVQYTGLKDKNGKEIYEGDILRWKCKKSGAQKTKKHIVTLNWDDPFGRYAMTIYDNGERWAIGSSDWNIESREVIGNIYENPELLEGE